MYKYLLCWRYLRTRYIALASIISVMLGVATMIVVNSVMAGFSEKMRDRLHGVLSDVVVEGTSFDGFRDSEAIMSLVRQVGGDRIKAMATTIETPGILTFYYGPEQITRPVQIIGVDPKKRAATGDFAEFLRDEHDRKREPSFKVDPSLRAASNAGQLLEDAQQASDPDRQLIEQLNQFAQTEVPSQGAILGYALATYHQPGTTKDLFLAPRGAKIVLTFPSTGRTIEPRRDDFTVVGFFKSGMSEYDSSFVYIPIDRLQFLRGMGDGQSPGAVNQIQIKVTAGTDLDKLAADLSGRSGTGGRRSSGSRPGSRNRGRCSPRYPSSRAS